jgi:hypothetical protein
VARQQGWPSEAVRKGSILGCTQSVFKYEKKEIRFRVSKGHPLQLFKKIDKKGKNKIQAREDEFRQG